MSSVKFMPDGYNTVSPQLIVRDAVKAIAFYKAAFGAEQIALHLMPDGKTVMHGRIQVGDSAVLLAEENPAWKTTSPLTLGNSPVTLHLFVRDVDATFNQAVKAGATAAMPPMDMFWGDRYAKVIDPFGHHWSIATHVKDLTEAEIEKAGQEFMAKMSACKNEQ
jgi:PhnB protein